MNNKGSGNMGIVIIIITLVLGGFFAFLEFAFLSLGLFELIASIGVGILLGMVLSCFVPQQIKGGAGIVGTITSTILYIMFLGAIDVEESVILFVIFGGIPAVFFNMMVLVILIFSANQNK